MLVLLPRLERIESPWFTTFLPLVVKFRMMYSSSVKTVLGRLLFLSLKTGTSRWLPERLASGDRYSPACDALRGMLLSQGIDNHGLDFSFDAEDDDDMEGE